MDEALKLFGLGPGATKSQALEAWRRLRTIHHPDHGGNAATFIQYKVAYSLLAANLPDEAVDTCPTCKGTGTVELLNGWNRVRLACPLCRNV